MTDFSKMISEYRFRDSSVTKHHSDGRNVFSNDYSRMILSSHVRRLQDKAQVFPLEKSDFVRTRLTHSLEVANFGRSLGLSVENKLIEKGLISDSQKGHLPSILEVAGLIHDIGNPPFGHFGEDIIKQYFNNIDSKSENIRNAFKELTEEQKSDFKYFDGNVQGFRILRKLGLSNDGFSYNLTMPVLATIVKYPYSSCEGNDKSGAYSQKKFGYFQSEKEDFDMMVQKLGLLKNKRHPLTFLLEAADDIAYSVSDIEDGVKLNTLTIEKIKNAFIENDCKDELDSLKELESNPDLYVQRLRINSQSKMLIDTSEAFVNNIDGILDGTFDEDLIKASKAGNLRKVFEDLSVYNFSDLRVLKRELLGEEVVRYLINLFYDAVFSSTIYDGKLNKKSKEYKIYSLISENYKKIACEKGEKFPTNNYKKFMLVTDFISGMTDSYALNLYSELKGLQG